MLKQVIVNDDDVIYLMINFFKFSFVALIIIMCWLGVENVKNYLFKSKRFNIASVQITGCNLVPESTIKNIYSKYCLEKSISENSNIFNFNIDEMHLYILKQCNALENVYISRNFDYSIGINLLERKPSGIIKTSGSKLKMIDASFNIFDIPDKSKLDFIFFEAEGFEIGEHQKTFNNPAAAQLIKIESEIPKEIMENASEIDMKNGYFCMFLKNGIRILCLSDNYLGKLDKLPLIYNYSNIKIDDIEYIDLRFKNIYIKLKKN